MKLVRLAVELVLDVALIAVVVAIVAGGRRPAPPALDLAHDPARCSACTHPNAGVPGDGTDDLALVGWPDERGPGPQSR